MKIHTLDLSFQGIEEAIAAFLIETADGLTLIECGPASTFHVLEQRVKDLGFSISNIKHIFLTHIHFDHAGAAWKFPDAKIYVHPNGLKHLAKPDKLINSAKQIYKDKMDELWGEIQPVSEKCLVAVSDGDAIEIGEIYVKVHYTPGHAVHHNAYQLNDVVFTGDVGGVRILDGPVFPPCPPPDINIELWKKSIEKIRVLNSTALYLTHFGKQENPNEILNQLENGLDSWSKEVEEYYKEQIPVEESLLRFALFVKNQMLTAGLKEDMIEKYEKANPSWMSVNGLLRYFKLRERGRILD